MALNKKLLALIGKLNPKAYDILFPHGPVGPAGKVQTAHMHVHAPAPQDVGAAMAASFAATQFTARRLGIAFDGEPDDWCPTGRPIKLPPGSVFPPGPDPEPILWREAFYLGFASRMAVIAETADKEDRAVFDRATDFAAAQLERSLG